MIQRVEFPGGEAAPCFSPPACLEWDSQLHWPSEVQESWEEKGKLDCLSLTLSMVLNHWLELRRAGPLIPYWSVILSIRANVWWHAPPNAKNMLIVLNSDQALGHCEEGDKSKGSSLMSWIWNWSEGKLPHYSPPWHIPKQTLKTWITSLSLFSVHRGKGCLYCRKVKAQSRIGGSIRTGTWSDPHWLS